MLREIRPDDIRPCVDFGSHHRHVGVSLQVDESHEGVYSCTPYNTLGTEGASGGVRVRVLRAPRLSARPQPLYVARLGDTLTLPCAAAAPPHRAAPAPTLRWTRVVTSLYSKPLTSSSNI